MSEAAAERLKWLLRAYLVAGGVYVLAVGWRHLEREVGSWPIISVVLAIWLLVYLEFFLGVAAIGFCRLFRIPQGRRFAGLAPGEEARLRLNFAYGSLNWASYNGVFKLLLTNQRLLVGANLTNWFLIEIPLVEMVRAIERKRRLLFPSTLEIVQSGGSGAFTWKIGVANENNFCELVRKLGELGVRVEPA